ncbi:MAG: glycosyltransferase family 4 protein [Gammaproteobacteria bacterium]|nr:glycosyltransferase family 4 protein [Gammaproteobacteria bacterium]
MSRIHLVYLASTLGHTGPTRQLYNLLKYIDRKQFDTSIVTLSDNPEDNLEMDFKDLGTKIYPMALSRFASALIGRRRLSRLLQEINPDILHSQGLRADWLSSRLDRPFLRISTQRNNPKLDYPSLMGHWTGGVAAILHQRALNALPVVVTCSQALAQNDARHNRASNIIHNGVDLMPLPSPLGEAEKAARRSALGLPVESRLFVFAGPLIPRKNPKRLIKTLKMRASQGDALVILGGGPLLPQCEALAGDAQNIVLPGTKTSVAEYLRLADCFVSASNAEGLPNAVLEALACGLPVLLSDIPAHREILALSPAAGELFSVDRSESLNEVIQKLKITDHHRTAARALAMGHFSAETMSHSYQDLYQSATGRSGQKN